ncbi:Ig-like domain-containing protein [Photobacterium galatheae]|uniref:Bacterial Ig-like domain-containing protein n=1 Tax=Photobacterium galatheae TaxID=1654360 RepID=A0A066RPA8_9GAMM|nr:Ig-like domain-containing protein [Photobacterium galatheae]KDM90966.1 hypothetical protein EA58_14520 [Photobacterium galatheae]MCM0149076.1 Ig-like domain repeat protein [Photobacterium galatheae]
MKRVSFDEIHNGSLPIVGIKNAGFDLIVSTSGGEDLRIEDGLTELVTNRAKITFANGSVVDYKSLIEKFIVDDKSIETLDINFVGDSDKSSSADKEGTGVKESAINEVTLALKDFLDTAAESDLEEVPELTEEEIQAALKKAIEDAKAQKEASALENESSAASEAQEAQAEEASEEDASKESSSKEAQEQAEQNTDQLEEMQNELRVEKIEPNDNTSKLTGEYETPPAIDNNNSSNNSGKFDTEGEPKAEETYEFKVSLKADSDSGAKGDFITNVGEPVFTGTGMPTSVVTITIDGVDYTTTVDGEGKWVLPPIPQLEEGEYSYSAKDTAGNKVSGTLVIDQTNTLTHDLENDTGVSDSDNITQDTRLVFVGKTDAGAEVVIKINNKAYQATANANGDYTLKVTDALQDKTYDYEIISTDVAGNEVSEVGSVTVDTKIDATVALSSDDDSGSSNSDGITKVNENLTFAGKIEAEATAFFQFNGTKYPVQIQEDGSWSITVPAMLEDKTYAYQLEVTDVAGNHGVISGEVVVDTTTEVTGGLDQGSDTGRLNDDGITMATKPYFSGEGEPKATVVVTIHHRDYQAVVGSDGRWKLQVTEELPEGDHPYTIVITDLAGNTAEISNTITVDRGITVSADLETDTGVSDSDGITQNKNNVIVGQTEAGATGTITITGVNHGQPIALAIKSDGSFSFETGELEDATYEYTIHVVDKAGNEASLTQTLTVDTQTFVTGGLDAGSDSGVSHTDAITNQKTPAFSGEGEPNSSIVFKVNDQTYSAKVNSEGRWRIDVTDPLPDGKVQYEVIATDLAGNTASFEAFVTIDTKAPTNVTVTLDNDSGENATDWITNARQPKFSGTVEAGCSVVVTINDRSYGVEDGLTIEGETWSFTYPDELEDDVYDIKIVATDTAGNDFVLDRQIKIDSQTHISGGLAPESDSGVSNSDRVTNMNPPTFKGQAEENAEIQLNVGGKDYIVTSDSEGNWSFTVDKLSEGEHLVTMTVTDVAGNTQTITQSIEIDTTDPVESTLHLKNDSGESASDFITKNNVPSLQGQAEPESSVEILVRFENGETYRYQEPDVVVNSQTGEWRFISPIKYPDGSHEISIISTDAAGNDSVKTQTIVVDTQIELTSQLDPLSDSGEKGDRVTKEQTPTFQGTGTAGDTVTLTINGNAYSSLINENGEWSITVSDPLPHSPDQAYEYKVVVVDVAGNTTSRSDRIFIDTETRVSGGLDSTSDSGAIDGITNDNTPKFSGQAEAGATVVLTIDRKSYETVADDRGRWSIQINTALVDNSYPYTITATDKAGNSHDISDVIRIDTKTSVSGGLDASSDSGSADNLTNINRPFFSGKGEVGSLVTVTINGKDYQAIVDENQNWKVQVTDALPDDEYTYQITAVDIAGNKAMLPEGTIEIDTKTVVTGGLAAGFDSGSDATDRLTKFDSPKFAGTGEVGGTVTITIDGREYSAQVDSSGQWEIEGIHNLSDGRHPYEISIVDAAGNRESFKNDLTVDTTPPEFTPATLEKDTGAKDNDLITKEGQLVFVGRVSEADTRIELSIDGQVFRTPSEIMVEADGSWRLALPEALAENLSGYNFKITYTDAAGNPATQSGKVIVDTSNTITGGLSVSSDSGIQGDKTTNVTKPVIAGSTEANAKITLLIDNKEYTTVADSEGRWSIQTGHHLSDKTHTYTVISEDFAGNRVELTDEVTVDTTASSLSSIFLDNDSNIKGDWVSKNADPQWSGTLEKGTELTITVVGGGKTIVLRSPDDFVVDANGQWTASLGQNLSDSNYRVTFDAIDKAGNPSSITHDLVIDTAISLSGGLSAASDTGESSSDQVTSNNTPVFKGEGEAGATVTLVIQEKEFKATVDEDGRWSISILNAIPDGVYPVAISIKDTAGNEKALPITNVTIDTTDPVIESVQMVTDTGVDTSDGITKESSPAFAGKTEPNTKIVLEIAGQRYTIPESSIDSEGNWSFTVPIELPDNPYTWRVIVTDKAGNTSESTGNIKIDTTNTLTGGLAKTSDTGVSSTDKLTNDNNPTFEGGTEAGAQVTLRFADGTSYQTTASEDGFWSIDVTDALTHGRHEYEIISVDTAGNEKIIKSFVNIDIQAPAVTINLVNDTGSSSTDGVTKSRTPIFSGTSEAGASVELTINNITYGPPAVKVNANGEWSFVLPIELEDGKYRVDVVAIDQAGNRIEKDLNIEIDNSVSLNANLKASSDTGSKDNDAITREQMPEYEGTADAGSKITFTVNGKRYTAISGQDEKWELAITDPLPEGTHHLTITVEDKAGNTKTIQDEITIDRTAIMSGRLAASSDSGVSDSDKITSDQSPLFTGVSELGATVTVTINGVSQSAVVAEDKTWSIQWATDLLDGRHKVEYSVLDVAGNTSSFVEYVTIDTNQPNVPQVTLVNDTGLDLNDNITKENRPQLAGVVAEGESVMLMIDSVIYRSPQDITINASGEWSFRVPVNLDDNTYPYTVVVEDLAGNRSQMTGSVTVDTQFTMTYALDVDSDSGEKDDFKTKNQTPTFNGQAENGAKIVIEINSKTYETIANTDGSWALTIDTPLPHGDHNYVIHGVDKAGNKADYQGKLAIDIETELKGGLDDSSNSGDKTDLITNSETIKFSGVGEAGANLTINIGGKTYESKVDAYGRWEYTVPDQLPEGQYPYEIIAVDAAGNEATLKDTIEIDRTNFISAALKAGSDSGDASDHITNVQRPTFVGSTQANTEVKLIVNGSTTYTLDVQPDGTFEFQIPSELLDGKYNYVFESVDRAGNKVEAKGHFVIDTQAELSGGLDASSDSGVQLDRITSDKTPTFSGDGEVGAKVILTMNHKNYETIVAADRSWSITLPEADALADDIYRYVIQTIDIAGNVQRIEETLEIDSTVTVTAAMITDTGYDDNDGITSETQPTFAGNMEIGATLSLTMNHKTYTVENGVTVNPDGTWSFTLPVNDALADGDYPWVVNIIDAAGNTNAVNGVVTIDTTDPSALTVSLTNGSVADQSISKHATPEFGGQIEKGTRLEVKLNGQVQPSSLINIDEDGNWRFVAGEKLADNDYIFEFTSTDAAGNAQTIRHDLTIDTATTITGGLDEQTNSGAKNDLKTNAEALKFSGSGEAGSTVQISINRVTYETTVLEDGTWSFVMPDSLAEGSYSYHIVATDAAGNTDELRDTIVIDRTNVISVSMDADSESGSDKSDGLTNVKQPTFIGSTQAGATVQLIVNGIDKFEIPVNADGSFSFTFPEALSDGGYTFEFISIDDAGNQAKQSGHFTIDTVSEVTGGLDANSNSGDQSDSLTNFNQPKFSGTSEVGTEITLTINHKAYKTVVGTDKTWSVTIPAADALDDDTYDYTIVAIDKAGNKETLSKKMTVDTEVALTAVMTTDTGLNQNDGNTQETTPSWIGTMEQAATISLTVNQKTYTADSGIVVNPDGTWAFTLPAQDALSDGEYVWVVNIVDNAGNVNHVSHTVKVDTTAPTALTVDLLNGSVPDQSISSEQLPSFGGQSEAGTQILVLLDGDVQPENLLTVNPDGTWRFTVANELPEGHYVFEFISIDAAGNSQVVKHDLEIDTSTTVSGLLDASTNTGSTSDQITKSEDIKFSGKGESGSKIVINIAGKNYETTVDEQGNWALTLPDRLEDDVYNYMITATDAAGNTAADQGSIEVDRTNTIAVGFKEGSDSADSTDGITNVKQPTFAGTTQPGAQVTLNFNGTTSYDVTVRPDGTFEFTLPEVLSDGRYTYEFVSVDVAGNRVTKGDDFVIDTVSELTWALSSASDSGVADDKKTKHDTPTFEGEAEAGSLVTIKINNKQYTVYAGDDKTWSIQIPKSDALPSGKWDYTITSVDKAGNSKTIQDDITIDTSTFVTAVLMNDTGDDSQDGITQSSLPQWNGTMELGSSISFSINKKTYTSSNGIVVNSDGTWSLTLPSADELTDDIYAWVVRVVDEAGNVAEQRGSLTVDTQAPTELTVDLLNGTVPDTRISGDDKPQFGGNSEAGTIMTVKLNGKLQPESLMTVNPDGSWRFDVDSALSDGVYVFEFISTDAAGNRQSKTHELTIDTSTSVTGGLSTTSDLGEQNSDGVTSSKEIVFSGTGEPDAKIVLNIDGKNLEVTVGADQQWSIDVGELDGTNNNRYDYIITATDKAGNTDVVRDFIVVDTVAPIKPTFTLDSGSDTNTQGDWITKSDRIVFNGVGEPDAKIVVKIGSDTYDLIVPSSGQWQLDLANYPEGTHQITVTATDLAGNVAIQTETLVVDRSIALDGRLDAASDTGSSSSDKYTKTERPVFSGSSDPRATITVTLKMSDGSSVTLNAVADETGHWETDPAEYGADLENGTYEFVVHAVDEAGNETSFSDSFVVDRSISLTLKLDDSTNSGIFSDTLTNFDKPRFSGVGQANDKVTVWVYNASDEQVEIIHSTVASNGTWTADVLSALADGDYRIVAKAQDKAGNQVTHEMAVTIDKTPPTVLTGGLDDATNSGDKDDNITKDNVLKFSGDVEAGCTVSLVFAGGKTYKAIVNPDGSWSHQMTEALADGNHLYTIVATDAAGNSTEISRNVTIDRTINFTGGLAEGSDTGWEATDYVTSERRPVFEGSTDPFSTVVVTLNTVPAKTISTVADKDGNYSINLGDLYGAGGQFPEGSHSLTFTATDPAGNESTLSKTLVVDSTDPLGLTLELADGSDSNIKGDFITNDSTPVIGGKVEFKDVRLMVKVAGNTFDVDINPDGTWQFAIPMRDDGVHPITIIAEDKAGNRSVINQDLVVDTQAPGEITGRLSASSDKGQYINDGVTNINQNLSFDGQGEIGATVVLVLSGKSYTASVDATGHWDVVVPDLIPDGKYQAEVRVTDKAGNTSSQNIKFEVDTLKPEMAAIKLRPEDDTGEDNADGVTNKKSPTITGSASTDSAKIWITIDGTSKRYEATIQEDGTWHCPLTNIGEGEFTYTVHAVDAAGNSNESSGHTITVDTKNNVDARLDEGSDSGASSSDGITNTRRPTFSGTTDSGNKVILEILDKNGTVVFTEWKQVDGTEFSFTVGSNLPQGDYTWRVIAVDKAGNAVPDEGNFTIDTQSTTTAGLSSASDTGNKDDNLTNLKNPVLAGSAEDSSEITIKVTGNFGGSVSTQTYTAKANATGMWSFTIPDAVRDGHYTYEVTAVDKAGNTSLPVYGQFDVDMTPPSVEGHLVTDSGDPTDKITNGVQTGDKKGHLDFAGTSSGGATKIIITIAGRTYNVTPNPDGTWEFVVPDKITDGKYPYTFVAEDSAGNRSDPYTGEVTIDTKIDGMATLAQASDSGEQGDNLTNKTKPLISGSGEAGLSINASLSGGGLTNFSLGSIQADEQGKWTLNIGDYVSAGLSDGAYTITLSATDKAGNTGDFTYRFNVDTTPPVVNLNKYNASEVTTDKPKISGSGEAGATVVLVIDNETFSTKVGSNGQWEFAGAEMPSFPDGIVDYSVYAVDKAGNRSENVSDTVTINTGTFVEGTLDETTDTGVLNTDGITQNRTPAFKGNGEAGGEISVLIKDASGTVIRTYTTTVARNGVWEVAIPADEPLSDGTYSYVIQIKDSTGNVASVDEKDLIIDNTLAIESMRGWSGAWGGSKHGDTWYLASSDNQIRGVLKNKEKGAEIKVVINGQEYVGLSDKNGNFNITLNLTDGTYDAKVYVSDVAGNTTESSLKLDVDSVSDWTLASDDDVTGDPKNWIVATSRPTFSGTNDAENAHRIKVVLYGDTTLSFVAVITGGQWKVVCDQDVPDGTYVYSVIYLEKSGRAIEKRGTVIVDTVNEVMTLADLDKVTDAEGNWISTKVTGFGEPHAAITVTLNGVQYTTKVSVSGKWTVDLPIVENGAYDFNVNSRDRAGNEVNLSENPENKLVVDFIDNLTVDLAPDAVFNPTNHPFTGKGDPGNSLKIEITDEHGNVIVKYAAVNSDGTWFMNLSDLADGLYTVKVIASSNWGEKEIITNLGIDKTPPAIESVQLETDTGFDDSDGITSTKSPAFSGKVEAGANEVTLTIGGVTYRSGEHFVLNQDGTWTFTVPVALADQEYTYTVTVSDAVGNATSKSGTVTIQSQKPALSEITIEDGTNVNGNIVTNNERPELSGRIDHHASKIVITIGSVTFESGKDFLVFPDGTWKIELPQGLTEGDHIVTIRAENAAGIVTEETVAFEIDLTPPQGTGALDATANEFAGENTIINGRPIFSGMGEAGATVMVHIGGKSYSTTVGENGNWQFEISDTLADNKYLYVIEMLDRAGNKSQIDYDMIYVDSTATPPAISTETISSTETHLDLVYGEGVVSGTGEFGEIIELALKGQTQDLSQAQKLTAEVDFEGHWVITVPDTVVVGDYTYSISKTDLQGDTAVIQSGAMTVTAPEQPAEHTSNIEVTQANDQLLLSGYADPETDVLVIADGVESKATINESGAWSAPVSADATDVSVQMTEGGKFVTQSVDTSSATAPETTETHLASVSGGHGTEETLDETMY